MKLENLVEYIVENCKGQKILDASSANGYLSYLLAQKGIETLPLYDSELVADSPKTKKWCPVVASSISHYVKYFDIVILDNPGQDHIANIYRKIKDGASLIIADSSNGSWTAYNKAKTS